MLNPANPSFRATAPDINDLKPIDKGASSEIFAADGSRLGFVQSDIIRTPVSFQSMPVAMRRATVAIEDERFYKHKGVDVNAIVRAGIKNLESGETVRIDSAPGEGTMVRLTLPALRDDA